MAEPSRKASHSPEMISIFLLEDLINEVNGNLPSGFKFLWIQPRAAAEGQGAAHLSFWAYSENKDVKN